MSRSATIKSGLGLNMCAHVQVLGAKEGFFVTLVESVVANFGGFYPELVAKRDHITEVIRCGPLSHWCSSPVHIFSSIQQLLELLGHTWCHLYDGILERLADRCSLMSIAP
jgi:hypothetical protein